MHLVSSFEGFALYRQSLKLREQLWNTRSPEQYQTLHEKITDLLSFAKEKLELAAFSIPVRSFFFTKVLASLHIHMATHAHSVHVQDSIETLVHLGKTEAWLAANTSLENSQGHHTVQCVGPKLVLQQVIV